MSKLTDFLHPLWQKAYQNKNNSSYEVNNAILEALDQEMSKVEQQTLSSKMQLFLRGASEEWLDYWGSWFGLKRQDGQSDTDYRNSLIKHVEHPRDTIPALRKAMALFMNEDVSAVHVYEPWTDIFILNDSKLNSKAHLMGDYYQYGVIDLQVNRPFNSGLIDVINWFRPGGVIWVLTYSPSDNSSTGIWPMSPLYAGLSARLLYIEDLIGLNKHLDNNLTVNTPSAGYGLSPFILNSSLLNGTDVIKGSNEQSARYYNSMGYLTGLITPKISDGITDFNRAVIPIDASNYDNLSTLDNQTVSFQVSNSLDNYNYLNNTASLDKWSVSDGHYLTEETYRGRAIMEFSVTGSQSFAPNKIHLVQGNSYIFSTFGRYLGNMQKGNLKLVVSDGVTIDNIAAFNLIPELTNDFTQMLVSFNWSMPTGDYYVGLQAVFEGSQGCLIDTSSIMLRDASTPSGGFNTSIPEWVPSVQDYPADYNQGNYYVYGAFNIKKFYYEHVESPATVANNLASLNNQVSLEDYISNNLSVKNLIVAYKGEQVPDQSALSNILIYNFKLNIWENYSTKVLTNSTTKTKISLNSLTPYINQQGLIFIGVAVSQLSQTYKFDLDAMIFYFDKVNHGDFAINLYSPDMTLVTASDTNWYNDLSFSDNNSELYAKQEAGYPIRRIKLTYQKLVDAGTESDSKAFVTNKSLLNGTDLIQDGSANPSNTPDNPNFKTNYVNGEIATSTQSGMTVLAAGFNNSTHQNLLGDLSSFDNKVRASNSQWACYDDSAILDATTNLAGFKTTTVKAISEGSIETTSNGLLNNRNYHLSYQISSDTAINITTKVYAVNNGISSLVGQSSQAIANNSNNTTTATDPFDQLEALGSYVQVDFSLTDFVPESLSIVISYNSKNNFQITNPLIVIDKQVTLDGQSLNYLPEYYLNDTNFISHILPINDNNLHTLEIDLMDTYAIDELYIGFTQGNYQLSLGISSSLSGNYQIIKSNFADNSIATLTDNQIMRLLLPSYNYLEDTVDKGLSLNQLIGSPDSHLSAGTDYQYQLSLMKYYFNTSSDLDIGIKNGDTTHRTYSYIANNDQVISPDDPALNAPITAEDNLDLTTLMGEAYKYQGVYGYLVDHDRLNAQLNDPVEFYKETGITPTSTTTTTRAPETSFKYLDLKVIKFNLIQQVKNIVPTFLQNTDKLSLSDQVVTLTNILSATQTSATVSVGITSTNKVAKISAYNYVKQSWDAFVTVTDTTTGNATFTIPQVADYLSMAGLLSVGIYGEAETADGSMPSIITINSVDLPIVVSQEKLDNSSLQITDTLLSTNYPRVKKLSIDGSNLVLASVNIPNQANHLGIIRANVWSEVSEGTIELQLSVDSQTSTISSQTLDYGNQALTFSIDFDYLNTLANPSLNLVLTGTKQSIYLNSVQIFNCLSI